MPLYQTLAKRIQTEGGFTASLAKNMLFCQLTQTLINTLWFINLGLYPSKRAEIKPVVILHLRLENYINFAIGHQSLQFSVGVTVVLFESNAENLTKDN